MRKEIKWVILALLVVAFIAVGYARDFFAININYHLQHLQLQTEYSSGHSFFDFLNQYSYQQIYRSKYLLTAVFTVLNFALGAAFLYVLHNSRKMLVIYTGLYAAVFVVAALFFAGGYLVQNPSEGYHFARILMGFIQSPVPAAVLAIGYPLYRQTNQV